MVGVIVFVIMVKNKLCDFGDVSEGSVLKHRFSGSLPILSAKGSCSCVSVRVIGNDIDVVFKPDDVPYHLRSQGYYDSTKYISVVYGSGVKDMLIVKARVRR